MRFSTAIKKLNLGFSLVCGYDDFCKQYRIEVYPDDETDGEFLYVLKRDSEGYYELGWINSNKSLGHFSPIQAIECAEVIRKHYEEKLCSKKWCV